MSFAVQASALRKGRTHGPHAARSTLQATPKKAYNTMRNAARHPHTSLTRPDVGSWARWPMVHIRAHMNLLSSYMYEPYGAMGLLRSIDMGPVPGQARSRPLPGPAPVPGQAHKACEVPWCLMGSQGAKAFSSEIITVVLTNSNSG